MADVAGNEHHVGIVNEICAFHPKRGVGHKSGRDDTQGAIEVVRTYPSFHEIVVANQAKFTYDSSLEFFYRSKRKHRIGKGNCAKACSRVGLCLGLVEMGDCNSEASLFSVNATVSDTAAYCEPETQRLDGDGKRETVCCVCLEEDPSWCPSSYSYCSWGKGKWRQRKKGVRESEMLARKSEFVVGASFP